MIERAGAMLMKQQKNDGSMTFGNVTTADVTQGGDSGCVTLCRKHGNNWVEYRQSLNTYLAV